MIIPSGYCHVQHFFEGVSAPRGAAVTYGIANGGSFEPAAAAETCHNLFALHLLPNLAATAQLSFTRVKFGPNQTGPFGEFSDRVNGGASSPGSAPNLAYLIEKRTMLGGRQGQGRMYLPGVTESSIESDGRLSNAYVDQVNADTNAFLAALQSEQHPMYLLHSNALVPTEVVSLVVDPVAATQRRRMR